MNRIRQMSSIALASILLAVTTTPTSARSPTAAEHALVGHYYVGDGLDHRLCAVTLSFEPTVGGEVQARGCAHAVPELDQATRWWANDHGGPTFVDPLHKVQATFVEAESGLIANADHDRVLSLEPYTKSFLVHPGANLPGSWSYSNDGGDDPTGGCTVRFGKTGVATVSTRCPAALRGMSGGHWQASTTTVTLTRGARHVALAWGASGDTVFLPGGGFRLLRQK